MKNSIKTMLDSFVHDNASFISGQNVAEYVLTDTQRSEFGYFWFLTDEEITEFEQDKEKAKKHIQEIHNYINENYDYDYVID